MGYLHNKDWPLCIALKFNHVLETISLETTTAASKMGIMLQKSALLPVLCCALHDWLLTSIFVTADRLLCGNWNNYWPVHETVTSDSVLNIQAVSNDPRQSVNPVFCLSDSNQIFNFTCFVYSELQQGWQCSAVSFTLPREEVCDRGSVLCSEPSSHISKAINH